MASSDQFSLTSWLIQHVEKSSKTNFIDLTEIKSKFQSDVLVEVASSRTIGNLITKLFHGVKIKPGRCKDNWAKSTQRYYGLSWCKGSCDNAVINFNNLAFINLIHLQQFVFLCNYVNPSQNLWKKDEHNFPHFQETLTRNL
jgi:hypothetical protein